MATKKALAPKVRHTVQLSFRLNEYHSKAEVTRWIKEQLEAAWSCTMTAVVVRYPNPRKPNKRK